MDKMKGIAKGGWHPGGEKGSSSSSGGGSGIGDRVGIHRSSWKTDLKGKATGQKKDPYEEQRNHQSRPLASLQDPDSFGPPPKHSAYYDANGTSRTGTGLSSGGVSRAGTASSAASGPSGGWGASAVQSGYAQQKREKEERERQMLEEQVQEQKAVPYRTDTSGLRTDHLPKPPVRRAEPASPAGASTVNRTSSPALPPRQPPRQAAAPPPSLPPRQNEYPDEYTPAPPPAYNEALRDPPVQQHPDPAAINQGAMNRLTQAGVSVPGFGIGSGSNAQPESPATRGPPAGQLSELQQRFARMGTGASSSNAASPSSPISPANGLAAAAAAAHKKAPPPPPPKKSALHAPVQQSPGTAGFDNQQAPTPPPLPMSSKPRPS